MTDLATLSLKELDAELLARRDLAESTWLDFCEVAYQVVERQAYVACGYEDPVRYFQDRVQVNYRKLRRALTIFEALQAIPPGEQEAAKTALVRIGQHKAAVLTPILRAGQGWQPWAEKAERLTERALQAEVSEATGNGRIAGAEESPGERFYKALMVYVPEDARPEVEATFLVGKVVAKTDNAMAVFLAMVREVRIEWEHRAAEKYR